jgi:hypothetical protein
MPACIAYKCWNPRALVHKWVCGGIAATHPFIFSIPNPKDLILEDLIEDRIKSLRNGSTLSFPGNYFDGFSP